MGTRADFYIQPGEELKEAIYLGSIAWDGYPDGIPEDILKAEDTISFGDAVMGFLTKRDDASLSERDGWPWPWEDSRTTDYAYVFEEARVAIYRFGCLLIEGPGKYEGQFPDMTHIQRVRWDQGSGITLL